MQQGEAQFAHRLAGDHGQALTGRHDDIRSIGKCAQSERLSWFQPAEWHVVQPFCVMREDVVTDDLRIVAAEAGKGSDDQGAACERQAQGADIGDESRPVRPAGHRPARHVVEHQAPTVP